jgi:cytochrome c peroxidase
MVFKVPSLRNVERTSPYFHDGSVKTLDEAVRKMGEYQLGRQLSEQEVGSIITWLDTLTGELPQELITPPNLPPDRP